MKKYALRNGEPVNESGRQEFRRHKFDGDMGRGATADVGVGASAGEGASARSFRGQALVRRKKLLVAWGSFAARSRVQYDLVQIPQSPFFQPRRAAGAYLRRERIQLLSMRRIQPRFQTDQTLPVTTGGGGPW